MLYLLFWDTPECRLVMIILRTENGDGPGKNIFFFYNIGKDHHDLNDFFNPTLNLSSLSHLL